MDGEITFFHLSNNFFSFRETTICWILFSVITSADLVSLKKLPLVGGYRRVFTEDTSLKRYKSQTKEKRSGEGKKQNKDEPQWATLPFVMRRVSLQQKVLGWNRLILLSLWPCPTFAKWNSEVFFFFFFLLRSVITIQSAWRRKRNLIWQGVNEPMQPLSYISHWRDWLSTDENSIKHSWLTSLFCSVAESLF